MANAFFKRAFTKLPRQVGELNHLIGAIDIETEGLKGGFVYGSLHHENWDKPLGFKSMREMLTYLFELNPVLLTKTIWFSHNGEFDWSRLILDFKHFGYYLNAIPKMEGKFFQLEVLTATGRKVTTWRDSYALWNKSLADLAKNFAPDHPKGETPLPFDPGNQAHVKYALNDAVCLVVGMKNLDKELQRIYGVHIKGTTASTGFQALLRQLPEDETYWRLNRTQEDWFRNCYYGGRVQMNCQLRPYEEIVQSFDINSSYPAQMRKGVPKGKGRYTSIFREGFPGFYYAKITMPDIPLPFIPEKDEHDRLSFPRAGVPFYTYVSSLELEYLVEMGGSFDEEDEQFEGFYFPEGLCYPFNSFVDMCETTRTAHKGTATEQMIKLIQNSVYGKFGTRTEGYECVITYGDRPEGFVCEINTTTGAPIPHMYIREKEREAAYMLPHWAAWITAHARLTLDRGIRTAGAENVLYIDTDSIKTLPAGTARMLASDLVGKVYGQFKDEGDIKSFRVIAPKVYVGYKNNGKGEYKPWWAVKGIPEKQMNDGAFHQLMRGEEIEVEYESGFSMTTSLKKEAFGTIRKRRSTNYANVYSHVVIDGRFYSRQANAPA